MKRTEKVEATLTLAEKKIFRALCEEAGCTEAELIRSVLIHREISLEDLGDDMQVSDRKKKALHRQQSDFRKAQNAREVDECGEPLAEKRNSYLRVMLTAPEKKAIEQRAAALGISASELVRRSERLKRFIKMLERSTGSSRNLKSVITLTMFPTTIWQMNLTTKIFKSERS